MENRQTVIAAGIGCRAGCSAEQLLELLLRTLAAQGRSLADVQALVAPDFKHKEPGLVQAAEQLHKPLLALPLEQLQRQAGNTLSHSARIARQFGVPCVAEAAALAGAASFLPGAQARLLGPRLASESATCALAEPLP
jgi:cobalt-precorrin 5A hydrolase